MRYIIVILIIIVALGLFALCKAAGDSDNKIEQIMQQKELKKYIKDFKESEVNESRKHS